MSRIAQVLLPLPLPEAFDYAEPDPVMASNSTYWFKPVPDKL